MSKKVIRNSHNRSLFVDLKDEEVLAKGIELALYQEEIERISSEEDKLKSVAKNLKADRESKTNTLACIAKIVMDKTEERLIECHDELDFDDDKVRTIRLDNDEVVDERTMRDSERQMELFPEDNKEGTDCTKNEG